jgi:hypothetical protein
MAIEFIKIDVQAQGASQANTLKQWIDILRSAYEIGERIQAKMNNMHDGTNFAMLEQMHGLPAGEGQTVFDLVNGTIGSMEGRFQVADAKTITETVG